MRPQGCVFSRRARTIPGRHMFSRCRCQFGDDTGPRPAEFSAPIRQLPSGAMARVQTHPQRSTSACQRQLKSHPFPASEKFRLGRN